MRGRQYVAIGADNDPAADRRSDPHGNRGRSDLFDDGTDLPLHGSQVIQRLRRLLDRDGGFGSGFPSKAQDETVRQQNVARTARGGKKLVHKMLSARMQG
jgi:hypothetical protein